MSTRGLVIEIKEKDVVVEMERTEACSKCKACTTGLTSKSMIIVADNQCRAKIGDTVQIQLEQVNFLKAVFIMYSIPLIMLIIGIIIGYIIGGRINIIDQELMAFIVGVLAVTITFLIIRKNESHFKEKKYKPTAIKVVSDETV